MPVFQKTQRAEKKMRKNAVYAQSFAVTVTALFIPKHSEG